MGNIIFRKKRVVEEELDEIQTRSKVLEEQIQHVLTSKHSAQLFSSLSMVFLVFVSVAFSLVNFNDKKLRFAYSFISVFLGVVVFYCVNWITNKYFNWSLARKRNAQEAMSKKKFEILEKIKETETFKVAKEILDKYGDVTTSPPVSSASTTPAVSPQPFVVPQKSESRGNVSGNVSAVRSPPTGESFLSSRVDSGVGERSYEKEVPLPEGSPQVSSPVQPRSVPLLKCPRPFLGAQRSVTDKLVDFLLGDGPNHRFALVCPQCYTHNGMAREEEFEYLSYRCWHCGVFNPSRRSRVGSSMNGRTLSERTLVSAPLLNRTQSESHALHTTGVAPVDTTTPLSHLQKVNTRVRSGSLQGAGTVKDEEKTYESH